jgi:hypothetical protein
MRGYGALEYDEFFNIILIQNDHRFRWSCKEIPMKKIVFLFAVFALAVPLCINADESSDFDSVFTKIAAKLSQADKKLPNQTVAIYGFTVIGRPGDTYAEYATEKLTHEIVVQGVYSVIERSKIDEIMKEQNLSVSGIIDAGMASKIGKILAVDAVIIGTIHVTEKETEFIARIIQSERGLILASADEKMKVGAEAEKATKPATAIEKKEEPPSLEVDKEEYTAGDSVVVSWSEAPGNSKDWVTIVTADSTDSTYGDWFYTDGKKSGIHTFAGVAAGKYEIRFYYNWPEGGYEVKSRIRVSVKEKAAQ